MSGNNPYSGGYPNSGDYPHGEQNPHGRDPFLGDPMGGMPDFQNPNNPIAEEYQEFVDQQTPSQPLPGFPTGYPGNAPGQYNQQGQHNQHGHAPNQPNYMPQGQQPLPGYPAHYQAQHQQNLKPLPSSKSRILAAVLAFFLGALGVHNFYLGYDTRAKWQLGLSIAGILTSILLFGLLILLAVGVWAFVEFVLILLKAGPYDKDGNGDYLQ